MLVYDWLPSERFKCQSLEVGKTALRKALGRRQDLNCLKDGLDSGRPRKGRLGISGKGSGIIG